MVLITSTNHMFSDLQLIYVTSSFNYIKENVSEKTLFVPGQVHPSLSLVSTSTLKLETTRFLWVWDLRWDLKVMRLQKGGTLAVAIANVNAMGAWKIYIYQISIISFQVQWHNSRCWRYWIIRMDRFWVEILKGNYLSSWHLPNAPAAFLNSGKSKGAFGFKIKSISLIDGFGLNFSGFGYKSFSYFLKIIYPNPLMKTKTK